MDHRTRTIECFRMLKFVTDKTAAPYFSNLVWFIGNHILEIDDCVRNDADHKSINKLKDVVAEHLDHLHYINDILTLNIESLNRVLTDHLLNRLFIPLYIYSFARNSIPSEDMKPYVSPVVALFLLCQVGNVIHTGPYSMGERSLFQFKRCDQCCGHFSHGPLTMSLI